MMKFILKLFATTLLAFSTGMSAYGLPNGATLKPRLVVCTDIAPGNVEPDDMESMVHLMTYADMFEIEALITCVYEESYRHGK